MPKTKPPKTEIDQGEKNKNNQKEKTIVEEKLQEINKKLEKKEESLNYEDIEFIVQYTKKHINNEEILNSILNILDKDIKLRKEKFKIDCIKELINEKLLLPKKIQNLLEKYNNNVVDIESNLKNNINLISIKLTAILYNEYTRLTKNIGEKFIKGEIKYDEYEERMKEYDIKFLKTSTIIK
jgi:hypothetical protein